MPQIPESTLPLSDDQIAFFNENGYLSIDRITTEDELNRMRAAYDDIFSRKAGRGKGNQFDLAGTDEDGEDQKLPLILEPRNYSDDLKDTLYESNALHICEQILGPGIRQRGSHAIYKPPRAGAETPWHQDEAYWNPRKNYRTISVWMPLQEATPENGCMQFVPGSHRTEIAPHRNINDDPRIQGLVIEDGHIDQEEVVSCPLPAGGATLHASRTMHYTGPNVSDIPRRAWILMFDLPQPDPETPRSFPWKENTKTLADEKRKKA